MLSDPATVMYLCLSINHNADSLMANLVSLSVLNLLS